MMNQEKRCPHCSKWSSWNGNLDDKCEHCGEYLKLNERIEIAEKEEKQKKLQFNFKEKFPFTVKEGDNLVVKGVKTVGYWVYFVFMSIMAVLLWIIFWLAS